MTAHGSVRDLQCVYNNQFYYPFYCKWIKPRHIEGAIRYYNVKITHNGKFIFEGNTNRRYIFLQVELIQEAGYKVTVTPVARLNGVTKNTSLIFTKAGMMISLENNLTYIKDIVYNHILLLY